jgi:hypothetical protein
MTYEYFRAFKIVELREVLFASVERFHNVISVLERRLFAVRDSVTEY